MKTILLLRHAKSDWDSGVHEDHGRPLAERGIRAARQMGRILADPCLVPDLCLCSTAVRARDTLDRAAAGGGWTEVPRRFEDTLYAAGVSVILEMLPTLPAEAGRVLFVGHEPGWSAAVHAFTGARVRMPTAALARIDFDVEAWPDVLPDRGTLAALMPPKLLQECGDR